VAWASSKDVQKTESQDEFWKGNVIKADWKAEESIDSWSEKERRLIAQYEK
jgi:hypothetical protein